LSNYLNVADWLQKKVFGLLIHIIFSRYLQEVVQVLESDPDFRKKLETADVEKIRDGSIANELEMVNHHVRKMLT